MCAFGKHIIHAHKARLIILYHAAQYLRDTG